MKLFVNNEIELVYQALQSIFQIFYDKFEPYNKIMHDVLVIQESQKTTETRQQELDTLQRLVSELNNLSKKKISKERKVNLPMFKSSIKRVID